MTHDIWLASWDEDTSKVQFHHLDFFLAKKRLKIHFLELVQIFAFQKLVLKNWRIWKKTVSSNMFFLQQILVPTSWFVYLKILSATSPSFQRTVPPGERWFTSWPDGGKLFWKKNMDRFAFGFKRQIYTHKTKLRYSDKLLKKSLSRFIKTTPSWKRCQNITISPKNNFRKTHRFKPLTSGVGSSTVRGGGSKHFWMNRCTAARGSADNSNLKASTNSWFFGNYCWSFQLKKSHESISEEELCHGWKN